MREFPKGGLIGKTVHFARSVSELKVPLYAANASFFIILAVFPALLLLLGVLQYTPLEVERLGELLAGVLPAAFLESAEELYEMGMDEYLGGDGVALVEWPGRCPEALPADFLMIEISPEGEETRRIRAVRHGGYRKDFVLDIRLPQITDT